MMNNYNLEDVNNIQKEFSFFPYDDNYNFKDVNNI